MRILFSAPKKDWDDYRDLLSGALDKAGIEAEIVYALNPGDPASIDYIVYAPSSQMQDFTPFTGAKAVLNLWAGVEGLVTNTTLTQPLARMVDPGLTEGMVEYCAGHTLRHHLGTDLDVCRQDHVWDVQIPKLARDRQVTVLGLGALGSAVGTALAGLNFQVTGWSRTLKEVEGITCLAGEAGLETALKSAEILILLLPLTKATENILNEDRLALLPKGAVLINPGRGPLVDDDALVAALASGRVSHATLDVFREEPLPEGHAFWANENITVTPHIASATRPSSAVNVIVENIQRGERGASFLHLVDRSQGY